MRTLKNQKIKVKHFLMGKETIDEKKKTKKSQLASTNTLAV